MMMIIKVFFLVVIWFLIGFIFGGAYGVKVGKEEERARISKIIVDRVKKAREVEIQNDEKTQM